VLAPAVAAAFDEMDARHRGEPSQVNHRQHEGALDQAVDQQLVPGRIDRRDAAMMPLEVGVLAPAVRFFYGKLAPMGFLAELAGGVHGVRATLPVPLVEEEDTDYARLRDPGTGAIWTVELNRGVYLDLGMDHWSELVTDARRQTRSLFESMMSARWPRLDDPAFSPLIEIEPFVLPGGAGLYVLHRSHMVPGHETVTGHTAVPTMSGLFHVWWIVGTSHTGGRESVLAAEASVQGRPIPTLDLMDSAVHDARFPSHVVSIARRLRSWWHGRLELTAPPPAPTRGRVTIPELGCSVMLPPRFAHSQTAFHGWGHAAYFSRASFSSRNGIDQLLIGRLDASVGHLAVNDVFAHMFTTAKQEASAMMDDHADVTYAAAPARRYDDPWLPSIVAVAEGTPRGRPRRRLVWEWSVVENQWQLWKILVFTTTAVPVDELKSIVYAVRDSLQAAGDGES
jgi:hypothetical protein